VEVAKVITHMATQSITSAMVLEMGLVLAAHEAQSSHTSDIMNDLKKAAYVLSHACPAIESKMAVVAKDCLAAARNALFNGVSVEEALFLHSITSANARYLQAKEIVKNLLQLLPEAGAIMTQCFTESALGLLFPELARRGNTIKVFCTETCSCFKDSTLTAFWVRDSGADVTVITDNMVASTILTQDVSCLISAADIICLNGTVVNKIGTLQLAICAKHLERPFYVMGIPSPSHEDAHNIQIERHDPKVTPCDMTTQIAKESVQGSYSMFDITPPTLVSAIITDRGIFCPYAISYYY